MNKLFQKISQIIYQKFTFFWILGTVALILIAAFNNWQISLHKSYNNISALATKISNKVDRHFEDVFQEAYSLPLSNETASNCKSKLRPILNRISVNNPKISGLIVSQNNQLICSTLSDNNGLIASSNQPRTISGPFNISVFDQPVYILQQKLGLYNVGIVILSSELQNVLTTTNENCNLVSLYNKENKRLLSIEPNEDRSRWLTSNSPDYKLLKHTHGFYKKEKLQSIDGVSVVVFQNRKLMLRNASLRELLVLVILSLTSFAGYFLMKNSLTKRFSLPGTMRVAIKKKEFYPVYQPLYDKETNSYSGVEILLRWQDSNKKIIMPDLFIEKAETSGLIVPITLQIVEIAFSQTKSILINNPKFHLSINISALHFTDATFFSRFNQLILNYDISPSQIIFEITERDLLNKNNDVFFNKMQELRQSGYSLAVDDYGTGHASISYLKDFPFNFLKIDKIFIHAIGTKAITESLNDAIIHMAKQLNLIIIAEGVETEEQVNYLSKNGVRYLQGWYFSKALPIEKLIPLLNGDKNE